MSAGLVGRLGDDGAAVLGMGGEDARRKCRGIFDERPDGRMRSAAEASFAASGEVWWAIVLPGSGVPAPACLAGASADGCVRSTGNGEAGAGSFASSRRARPRTGP